ncbi:hypothetical protein [Paenibacillus zanthoxyli]|uniref:hypothetical protein n=1 Tax=Paenibacillus zanthoxyli TaxID=369399 RepID=UPI000471EC2F|nr:hypothetical protein [Paenibacillus zanthoxyli]
MKKGSKVFIGFLMVSTLLSGAAFASTQSFSFSLSPGQLDYTGYYSKADSEAKAYVTTSSGNLLAGSDKLWYKVRNSANTVYTEAKWIDTYGTITLNYLQSVSAGGSYRLNAQQDSTAPYSVSVSGRWTP